MWDLKMSRKNTVKIGFSKFSWTSKDVVLLLRQCETIYVLVLPVTRVFQLFEFRSKKAKPT